MRKIVSCIIARTNSTRLPRKALLEIQGQTMTDHLIDRVKKTVGLDEIYLCTSIDSDDQILLDIARKKDIKSFAGSRDSVISRMLEVARLEKATDLIRITGDNPFTDEIYLSEMIRQHIATNAEYTRTEYLPIGVTAEVISVDALKRCLETMDPNKSEYLTVYIFEPANYKSLVLVPPPCHQEPYWSLTVDTPEDFERTVFIADRLGTLANINLNQISELESQTGIPHLKLNKKTPVKLPDGRQIALEELKAAFDAKIAQSTKIVLAENFYGKH